MPQRWIRNALIAVLFLCSANAALVQDIVLVRFTEPAYGVQGVIPESWIKRAPGLYVRDGDASSSYNPVIVIQSSPPIDESIWSQLGMAGVPESAGTYTASVFEWTLYQVDFDNMADGMDVRVHIALAERGSREYTVVLQSRQDESEALYQTVFVPVITALDLLPVTTESLPYKVEEVAFSSGNVTLAGTLTLPETERETLFPAMVLMTGSGPQNRDEEVVLGFPIFRLIADALTRQGIAVLRYDDRGVGQSTGDHSAATIQDFAADGRAAVAYLASRNDIDASRIGVLGHSEGALYAAMLGADADSGVAFIVSLAGTAVAGTEAILHQNRIAMEASGLPEAYIGKYVESLGQILDAVIAQDDEQVIALAEAAADELWALLTEDQRIFTGAATAAEYRDMLVEGARSQFLTPWYGSLIAYNPAEDWAQTTIPVLAIFGALDVQVDEAQNAVPLTQALVEAGNPNFSIVVLPGANHLFQAAETGSVEEYYTLPYEFVPALMPTLTDWVLQQVGRNG